MGQLPASLPLRHSQPAGRAATGRQPWGRSLWALGAGRAPKREPSSPESDDAELLQRAGRSARPQAPRCRSCARNERSSSR